MKLNNEKIINYVLVASSFQILESFLPHPIPAVRLGLANLISLVALINYGFKFAIKVVIARTLLSSLFLGTFLSVSFFLSFFSGIVSTFVMWLFFLISYFSFLKLSCLGISVIGAVTHNLTQILIVYLLFIPQKTIFWITPFLIFFGVVSGSINGWIGSVVVKKLNEKKFDQNKIIETTTKITPLFLSTSEIFWLVFLFFLLFVGLFLKSVGVLGIMMITLFFTYLFLRKDINKFLFSLKNILWILIFAFFVPLFSIKSENSVFDFIFFSVSKEGLISGVVYVLRILNVMLISNLVSQIYNKEKFIAFLKKFIFFDKELAEILAMSFYCLPEFLNNLRTKLKFSDFKSFLKNISWVIIEYF
ncbi:MAG: Gx transporter family protein [Endomicrobia bacterium]|nr:Gx transporter family protein [Endomicrobiia bacterium]